MRKSVIAGLAMAGMLAAAGLLAWAQEDEDEANPAGLAKVLPEASVSLEQGLKAGEREGKPISGKYEIEDGALQLSVYTAKGNQFEEVIVDHKSGAIEKAEPITEGDDLKDAQAQGQAIAQAKRPLDEAVGEAVKANGGFRAVRAIPSLKGGHPVAEVTLMQGDNVKQVSEKLD
jgi:hypothetical protein